MEPEKSQNNITDIYQKLVAVWGVLLTSQLIILSVLYFAKDELFNFDLSQPLAGKNPPLAAVAACLSLTAFALSFLLKARMVKQAEADQNPGLVWSAMIISCALCESISLLGLILALATDYPYFFLWFALGIFGIILHFPRKKHLMAASYKK